MTLIEPTIQNRIGNPTVFLKMENEDGNDFVIVELRFANSKKIFTVDSELAEFVDEKDGKDNFENKWKEFANAEGFNFSFDKSYGEFRHE